MNPKAQKCQTPNCQQRQQTLTASFKFSPLGTADWPDQVSDPFNSKSPPALIPSVDYEIVSSSEQGHILFYVPCKAPCTLRALKSIFDSHHLNNNKRGETNFPPVLGKNAEIPSNWNCTISTALRYPSASYQFLGQQLPHACTYIVSRVSNPTCRRNC